MALASCPGVLGAGASGEVICHDGAGTPVPWVSVPDPVPFDYSQIDPVVATGFFAAGFTAVGICFVMGYAVSMIVNMIGGRR